MLLGKCVDSGGLHGLVKGETYYLFECGQVAYYVSRFPRDGAHFGVFQKSRFELILDEPVFKETEEGQLSLF